MAKKTTPRANAEPKADAPAAAAAPAAKPRSRARASKAQPTDSPVALTDDRTTLVDRPIDAPTSVSVSGNGAAPEEAPASVSMASEPSEDDIRVRAYHRYLERGGGHGMDFEDWLAAKRELTSQTRK